MSRQKFLTIAVIFLLVLNTGMVAYLFFSRQPHPGELWKLVVREVGFDEQQTQQYLALRDAHRANMNRLDNEFFDTLNEYLGQLRGNANPTLEDSLMQQLASIERQKAEVTLKHFRTVKELCRPEQVGDFDRIVPELTRVMLPPKKDFPPRRN